MRFDFKDHYATIDGIKLRYWDEGAGEVIVLIHGLAVTIENWGWNMEALATKYRVIAFDIPGFGKSDRPQNKEIYNPTVAANILKKFFAQLDLTHFYLVGNSLGGWLSIQFALNYPEMVDKLILIDSAGLGKGIALAGRLSTVWPLGELLVHPTPWFITQMGKSMVYDKTLISGEFLSKMIEFSQIPGTKQAMLNILRSGVNWRGQFYLFNDEQLNKLKMPSLILWGKDDKALPASQIERTVKAIPDSRGIVFERAGHPPHMDRWEDFNKIVMEFLAKGCLDIEDAENVKRIIHV
jgi:pimeloyl-ACP methyl ester carboxylesterase